MEEQVTQILASLQTAVATLAPEVWTALLFAARLDSILCLGFVAAAFVVSAVAARNAKRLWAWGEANDAEPVVFLGGLTLAIVVIIAICVLFSTSTWLGLFYPEAAVIRDLMKQSS